MDITPIHKKFSKYAYSLDKVFKNQSLESFQQNILNPKKYQSKELELNNTTNTNENFSDQ